MNVTFRTKQTVICFYFKIFIGRSTAHVLLTHIQFFKAFKLFKLDHKYYTLVLWQKRRELEREGGKTEQEEGREGCSSTNSSYTCRF